MRRLRSIGFWPPRFGVMGSANSKEKTHIIMTRAPPQCKLAAAANKYVVSHSVPKKFSGFKLLEKRNGAPNLITKVGDPF